MRQPVAQCMCGTLADTPASIAVALTVAFCHSSPAMHCLKTCNVDASRKKRQLGWELSLTWAAPCEVGARPGRAPLHACPPFFVATAGGAHRHGLVLAVPRCKPGVLHGEGIPGYVTKNTG